MTSSPAAPRSPTPLWLRIVAVVATVTVLVFVGWLELYPFWAANHNLERAKAALSQYDFATAEARLQRTLQVRPDQVEASFLLAQLYRRTERYSEIKRPIADAKRGGWSSDYLQLEQLLSTVQERGPTAPAFATARLYVNAAHPEDRLIFEAMARGLLNAHQLVDAERLLEQWSARYADDWYPRFLLGTVREANLSWDQALVDYRWVLQQHPEHPEVRRRIADLFLETRKELPEAQSLYREQLQRMPNDGAAHAGLAAILDLSGQPVEALQSANRAVELLPDSSRALVLKAGLIRATDPAQAYQLALRAEKASPELPAVALSAAAAKHLERHQFLEQHTKRLTQLLSSVRQQPHDPDLRCEVGLEVIALGRVDDGVLWFHSAINESPIFRRAHELLADHYERSRTEPERAQYHRKTAKQLAAGKK
jgi:tetratricopeptide (TPR) repeat protein